MRNSAPEASELLDERQCLRLIAQESVGRLGFSSGALPVVRRVNFVLDGRTIVFIADSVLMLNLARAGYVACIEVDGLRRWQLNGWSVLATGRLQEVTDPARLEEVRRLPVAGPASRRTVHFVELRVELLSGRRIGGE